MMMSVAVSEPPSCFAGGFKEALDFFRGEVFAFARAAGRGGFVNCSLYASWRGLCMVKKMSVYKAHHTMTIRKRYILRNVEGGSLIKNAASSRGTVSDGFN
jgi:hypothetical protein